MEKAQKEMVEAEPLYNIVQEMLHTDKRFVGLSSYIISVKIMWSYQIPTACAGAGFIFFNPDFYASIPHETRKTVVAHEIWHLILKHLQRGEGHDHDTYNIAADHVINTALEDDGFTFEGTKPMKDRKYAGKSTEEVYNIIFKQRKKEKEKGKQPAQSGQPTKDQIEDLIKEAIKDSGKDLQKQIEEDEQRVDNATQGKLPGTGSGSENRVLQADGVRIFIQEKSYAEIFEKYFIDPLTIGRRTMMRLSRRQTDNGLRMAGRKPKKKKENRLGHLVYCLDVSGSISAAQAQQFKRSAETIKETLNPEKMTIILWDTSIKFEKTFSDKESLGDIKVRAGGGTDLRPVYAKLRQLQPEAAVIFTDLYVTIPPEPEWETIWFVPNTKCHIPAGLTYGEVYLVPNETKGKKS